MGLFGKNQNMPEDWDLDTGGEDTKEVVDKAFRAQRALFSLQEMLVNKVFDLEGTDAELRESVTRLQSTIRSCLGDVAEVVEGAGAAPAAPPARAKATEASVAAGTGGTPQAKTPAAGGADEVDLDSIQAESTAKMSAEERRRVLETDISDIACNTRDMDLARRKAAEEADIGDLVAAREPAKEETKPVTPVADSGVEQTTAGGAIHEPDDEIDLEGLKGGDEVGPAKPAAASDPAPRAEQDRSGPDTQSPPDDGDDEIDLDDLAK